MKPILADIGPFHVFSYGLFLSLSFLISSFVIWKYGREELIEEELMDTYVYTSLVALLFSRVFYILFHFNEFGGNILKYIIVRENPGLSIIGGLLGGVAFLFYYTKRRKINTYKVADIFALTASLGLSLVSVGEFLGGATFGRETNLPWGVQVAGVLGKRHPTELYGFILFLILFMVLRFLYKKRFYKKEGYLSLVFLVGYSLIVFLLEIFKVGSVYLYDRISLNQVFAIGILIISSIPFVWKLINKSRK
ncbi:prolipoprotein diacylglyceryl transferase [Candidatus Gottesmanbacteria bacterium]|nr:prolipoprotein diacylglyceryl transferase [Candidatus Gottesmanbacteria bacterium]